MLSRYEEMILSRWPYIFVGCLAFVLIVVGLIIWRCCVRRKQRRAARAKAVLLPDTAPRSPGPHPVSFRRMEEGDMEMRQNLKGYAGSEYRSSFASSRTRV